MPIRSMTPGAPRQARTLHVVQADGRRPSPKLTFPIVGVGASAGGLDAFRQLLAHVPARVLRRAQQRGVPVLLPFALPRRYGDAGRGREYVAALIRRAIGYAVRLGGAGGGRGP